MESPRSLASAIQDYTHLITVESGVWRGGASAGDFGAAGTTIDVKDGASLYLTGSNPSNLVANALSGRTVNLYGAKAASMNAKIVFYNKTVKNLGSNVSINLKDSDEMFFIASDKIRTLIGKQFKMVIVKRLFK